MNILITGCKGQLGTEIHKIASTDTLHNWHFTDVDTLDICNAQAVENYFETNKIQVCINCAAEVVEKIIEDTLEVYFEYPLMGEAMRIVKEEGAKVLVQDFTIDCRLKLSLRKAAMPKMRTRFENTYGIKIIEPDTPNP